MVRYMVRTASGPSAPTAAALSYRGRSSAPLLASRATAPPSSSTASSSGTRPAACRSAVNAASWPASAMFLPNSTTPPTGMRASVARMASVRAVAPAASGSSICCGVRAGSSASGRTRKSWPTFSSSVRSAAVSGAAVGAAVGGADAAGRAVGAGSAAGAPQPVSASSQSARKAARPRRRPVFIAIPPCRPPRRLFWDYYTMAPGKREERRPPVTF